MAGERHGRGMLCVNPPLGLLYRMTLRTEPSDRHVSTRAAVSRNVDLGTRCVTVCVVSLVAGRSGGKRDNDNKRYTMRRMVLQYRVERVSCYKYGRYRHR
jgi:hypothetical protein